jgi:hypothetical protein
MSRGIRPVPIGIDAALRGHLTDMRQVVLRLQGAQEPPRVVPNFTVTPLPGGNLLQWTTTDADYYQVLWSADPNIAHANQVFAGGGSQYTDYFGAVAKRWYWIYSWKNNGARSILPAGPQAQTSGALGTPVVPPTPPTPGDQQIVDIRTDFPNPRGPVRIGGV